MEPFLKTHQVVFLRKEHKRCKEKRHAYRINSILLLNSGYSYMEVADLLLLDDDTIRSYFDRYIESGLEGLLEDKYFGGLSLLTESQQLYLVTHLEETTYLSVKEIVDYIFRRWEVQYNISGLTFLLHRLGFSYKKPKLVPGKANITAQKEFIKAYRELKRSKGPNDQIYFADGCHPLLNPIAGYGWIKKGVEKEIPSNTGRQRINLNGAYNQSTSKAIIVESEQINAQSTIELLEKIKVQQPKGNIFIIPDNAKYYRSKLVAEYLIKNPRIIMKFLPPYSPNLNLIERLWHFYKKKILYHKYYPTLAHMRKATWKFFNELEKYEEELKSLITENFQIINSNFSKTYVC